MLYTDFYELKDSIDNYCIAKRIEIRELLSNNYFVISKKNVSYAIISDDNPRALRICFRSTIDNVTWEINIASFKRTAVEEDYQLFGSEVGRNNFAIKLSRIISDI